MKGHITKANHIDIWYETFGDKSHPAALLIMGGLSQGILWPIPFCQQLASEGFYVIRYDHRDTGYSGCFDYSKNPYTLLDMAHDAAGLLEALQVTKAHLFALSMGGPIAELISVHYPHLVASLTLMATSPDFRPSSLAYDEVYPHDLTLSRPTQRYQNWMHEFIKSPPKTFEDVLKQRVECWRILNGPIAPFEESLNRDLQRKFLLRLKSPKSLLNHLEAIKNSFDLVQTVPRQVKVPTVILQGSEDCIFPKDHGEELHKAIEGSKFVLVNGMGHVPNSQFYSTMIKEFKENASRVWLA